MQTALLTIQTYTTAVEDAAKSIKARIKKEPLSTVAIPEMVQKVVESHQLIIYDEWHLGVLYFSNNRDAWAEIYEASDLAELIVNENTPDIAIATMAVAAFTADITDELENLE